MRPRLKQVSMAMMRYFAGALVDKAHDRRHAGQRSRKSPSQVRTAARQSIDTSPATPVIRSRDNVRSCSVMTHDGRSSPLGPSTRMWFGHLRSVVVIGNTMTRVVTASKYPADATISTGR